MYLGVARIAGIMGVKKTSELIPLCHPLMINKVNIDFEIDKANCLIYAYCTVKCNGKTGVEMEALTGVNICLLTIYDMCKAVSKDMEIKNVHLVSKSGKKWRFSMEVCMEGIIKAICISKQKGTENIRFKILKLLKIMD